MFMKCKHEVTMIQRTDDGVFYNVCCDCDWQYRLTEEESLGFY